MSAVAAPAPTPAPTPVATPVALRAPIVINGEFCIPEWVVDLDSFRRWAQSDELPERVWISYLDGEIWVDLSMEKVAHNQLKGEYAIVLGGLAKSKCPGRFFHDRMLLTNPEAGLSTEPDGTYVSRESLLTGRVQLKDGADSLEIEGSPDMALEVVSSTSWEKDLEILLKLYWKAGIREYWLVDPRGGQLRFDIMRRTSKRFAPTRGQGGWIKSAVFGKSFRLTQSVDEHGLPAYRLEVR